MSSTQRTRPTFDVGELSVNKAKDAKRKVGDIVEQTYSITAQNPFSPNISPTRNYMSATHMQQSIELLNPEPKIIQSGIEMEMAKNTFSVRVEKDCTVLKVIERSEIRGTRKEIVELLIIVRDIENYIDAYRIPYHHQLHKTFGFKYEMDVEFLRSLRYGDTLKEGTILADTGAIKDDNFTYGVNANVALLSIDGVAEDGIIMSKSMAEKLSFKVFKKTRFTFGSETFPLNMYGDENNYIPFPRVGELVRPDGILAALRRYDDGDIMSMTSNKDLMEHDKELDVRYVVGRGGYTDPICGVQYETGKVVDIKAFRNDAELKNHQSLKSNGKTKNVLYGHTLGEINRHVEETEQFYKEIYQFYQQLNAEKDTSIRYKNKMDNPIKIRPELRNIISKSFIIAHKDSSKGGPKIPLLYKRAPQDIYSVEIITEHVIPAGKASKCTDQAGSKGIVVDVWDDDKMPITKDGVVADIIMDPSSVASRANVGRLYEQYLCAASRRCRDIIRSEQSDDAKWQHVLNFMQAIGTKQYQYYANANSQEQFEILREIEEKEFYIYYSVAEKRETWEMVAALEQTPYRPVVEPITLRHYAQPVETKEPCLIGPIYTMVLCKLGEDGMSSCSIPRFNHYMIAVNASNTQKLGRHINPSPLKILGETENRMIAAVAGPQALIELQDRNTNMLTIKKVIDNILESDTNYPEDLNADRSVETYGHSYPLKLLKHVFECGGIGMRYEPQPGDEFFLESIPGVGFKKPTKNSKMLEQFESEY